MDKVSRLIVFGQKGILGVKELRIDFNGYDYLIKATLSGVVASNEKRKALGVAGKKV